MKIFLVLSAFTTLHLANSDCSKKKPEQYKGKLEIAGICMNYTIRVMEGTLEPSLIAANWTDKTTKKSYTNVFKLGNPCEFPATIKQGDEFYFSIDTAGRKPCAVCMAYYPTPPTVLSITVAEK